MQIVDQRAWEDFVSIAALSPNYFTAEPFIEWEYDIRVQKVSSSECTDILGRLTFFPRVDCCRSGGTIAAIAARRQPRGSRT